MGAKCLVVYDTEGVEVPGYGRVHFLQRTSQQKQAMFDTDQAWRPVLPIGWHKDLPEDKQILAVRTGSAATLDTMNLDEQHAHLTARREANATGNHKSRRSSAGVRLFA